MMRPPVAPGEESRRLPDALRPAIRGVIAPFWSAAARRELRLPRCGACAAWSWPPRQRCAACGSDAWTWTEASGRGVVHTFTVVRQAADPWLQERTPYVVAMVELAEGPRIMSNVTRCPVDAVRIGMAVVVDYVDAGDGLSLPVFVPGSGGA